MALVDVVGGDGKRLATLSLEGHAIAVGVGIVEHLDVAHDGGRAGGGGQGQKDGCELHFGSCDGITGVEELSVKLNSLADGESPFFIIVEYEVTAPGCWLPMWD